MDKNLEVWLSENKLDLKHLSDNIYQIENFGKFIYLEHKENKIIDVDFSFIVYQNEFEIITNKEVDYILFYFGQRFYYSKINISKNEYNEQIFTPDFLDFKNIGKANEEPLMDFVHLGVHTEYELMNGSSSCEDWVDKAKFYGMTKLGICDKNTLAATLSFQIACNKAKIKSILGETITVAHNYNSTVEFQETNDVKLFVKNEKGWRNLMKINRYVNVDYNQFIPESKLLELSEGLILVFCKESIFNYHINDEKKIKDLINKYKKFFTDIYYQIDSVIYDSDELDLKILNGIKKYKNSYQDLVPPILINDSYYLDKEMFPLKEMINKIGKNLQPYSENQHFKTINDTFEIYNPLITETNGLSELLERACLNTLKLEQDCIYTIDIKTHKLPKYEYTENSEELYYELIQKGIETKLGHIENLDPYLERIEKECGLIVGFNLIDYFLILWDIVLWSKNNGIVVGVGRGSIGGSLVAYLLDITNIDPIRFDLLFERFLNESRMQSLPDVDLDFMAERRDDVKEYMRKRFGEKYVCAVGTYGRMKLKTCIKDFGKQKGLSFDKLNFICKDIDDEIEYTFTDFIKFIVKSKLLMEFAQQHPDIILLTKFGLMQAKTPSIHASAMVIVPNKDFSGNQVDIHDWVPIKKVDGVLVSEWEGKYIEKSGFLKEDILGLRQLDKFKDILDLIKKNRNEDLVLDTLPFDDSKTYKLFCKGYNEDVFQFNSTGLKSYSIKTQPENIEHLIAMNALYRPGPMDSGAHNDFSDIKNGKKKPKYDYGLKEVTEKTFGLWIYQEQIMQAVHVLGGLTLVESDNVRNAIKKFDFDVIKAFEEKFIIGAQERGCSKEEAEKIWKKLLAFSGYGFNRSHSAAYAIMSYWSQYLKAHYPLEFWTIALQHAEEVEIPSRLSEFSRMKIDINISPPDVNNSFKQFTCDVKENKIYWALNKIKGVGDVAVDNILAVREQGTFTDFADFYFRVPKNKVNKKVLERLIIGGAFDQVENLKYPIDRKSLLQAFSEIRGDDFPAEFQTKESNNSYFWTLLQKSYSGFGELDYFDLIKSVVRDVKQMKNFMEPDTLLACEKQYKECLVGGKVLEVREKNGKKAGKYGTLMIESNNYFLFITFWSDEWEKYKDFLKSSVGKLVALNGVVKHDTWRGYNVIYANERTKLYLL